MKQFSHDQLKSLRYGNSISKLNIEDLDCPIVDNHDEQYKITTRHICL